MSKSISRQVKTHFLFQHSQRNQNWHTFHLPFNSHTWPIPNANAHQLFWTGKGYADNRRINDFLTGLCLFVCFLPLYKNILAFTLQMSHFNSCRLGIPRRFSGYNSTLSLMGARLQSLARELRFRKSKEKKNSCRSLEGMEKNNQISVCPILKDTWLFQIYSVSP